MINKYFRIFLIAFLFFKFCLFETDAHEEDAKLIEHLNDLYKTEPEIRDTFDMFGEKKKLPDDAVKSVNSYLLESNGDEGKCTLHKKGILKLRKEFELCSLENVRKEDRIKEEKRLNYILQKKCISDNSVDVNEFYFRFLKHFWTILGMKNIQDSSDNAVYVRKITAKVRRSDALVISSYFESKQGHQQIDNFFRNAFEAEEMVDDGILLVISDNLYEFLEMFKIQNTWLCLLWGCFIFIVIWGFTLFLIDMQRQLKWIQVFFMAMIILFGISCLVHYRHLVQVKEARRHSYLVQKKDFNTVPDECHSGGSWFGIFRRTVFGGPSICDEYFENMMIEPESEISPAIVISETASKFLFHPLHNFGFAIGSFYEQFLGRIPYVIIIPVSILFLLMFTIVVLSFFQYGITLPFWLGSIKPERGLDYKANELKHMIKECERKMESANATLINNTREVLMDARKMLIDVSLKTFEEMQKRESQVDRHSLVQISTQVIENQLERMLCNKMSSNMTPHSSASVKPKESHVSEDSKYVNKTNCSNIALPWKESKDKVDGGHIETAQQRDFLHQLELVLGESLDGSDSASSSHTNIGEEGSFLDKMENIMKS